eukprot:2758695-Rhodomonas_salina.1
MRRPVLTSGMLLPGAERGVGAAGARGGGRSLLHCFARPCPVLRYPFARQCPVLRYTFAWQCPALRYAVLRSHYAVSGTDIRYAATRRLGGSS